MAANTLRRNEIKSIIQRFLRRYVASSMINYEVPVDTVKEILGHTQMDSMKSYMRISREKLAMCSLSLNGIEVRQEDLL